MKSELSVATIAPGRYVIAVSGGVDSMVLFDMLKKQKTLELVVAHFDHGTRESSVQDRKFVQGCVMSHNISFEFAEGKLGASVSEEIARKARYKFLRHICKKYNAKGIILAHHQDDLLETAIINLLRGTGRRGLSALQSHKNVIRPMLHIAKVDIIAYAKTQQLEWREDPTNIDQTYLRNYVRHTVLAKATAERRNDLLQIIVRQKLLNEKIDSHIATWLSHYARPFHDHTTLPRYQVIMLPDGMALEILQNAVKQLTGRTIVRPLAKKLLLFIKTAKPQKRFLLGRQWQVRSKRQEVIVEVRPPMVS